MSRLTQSSSTAKGSSVSKTRKKQPSTSPHTKTSGKHKLSAPAQQGLSTSLKQTAVTETVTVKAVTSEAVTVKHTVQDSQAKSGSPDSRLNSSQSDPVGRYARRAIKKALKKMVRHEADVLKDQDIEALHQMRIGLRRLRTTLQTFEILLDYPESIQDKTLKPLAKRLGRVRDLDVLLLALRDRHRPSLPKSEQKALDRVLKTLQKKRDRQFKRMKQFLKGPDYSVLMSALQNWAKTSHVHPSAALPIHIALPDLLLPVLSQTLLHPGWLAGPDSDTVEPASLNRWLDHQGMVLHDLRKQMKQLRYQSEFFASHYGPEYGQWIEDFKAIQDILGELQDAWILAQTLAIVEGPSWQNTVPTLAKQMHHDRWVNWQQWEALRQKYITDTVRTAVRHTILSPI